LGKLWSLLFNSPIFLAFFAVFFVVYWQMAKHWRAQNLLILFGSWFFYGWWDERFLILIGLSTLVDFISGLGASGQRPPRKIVHKALLWFCGLGAVAAFISWQENWFLLPTSLGLGALVYFISGNIDRLSGPVRRKAWLVFSLVTNLGLLGVFKYFGFFTTSFIEAFSSLGLQINTPMIHIILPVGISFYTFQTLSYTIDIYRKEMQPTDRFIDFAAYVAFFPQLIAGPIERARRLLPQFQAPRQWQWRMVQSGALLFLWGLYKKMVIADNLAPIVDAAFANPGSADAALITIGILAFAFQIYGDFSGYSDMARGLARMLGFELMLNFRLPYFSRTPSEFWRRWHISLSTWLRDYLYIPLGGNKGGTLLTYRNLMLTMLLGGLWHGAAWTFVFWGAFHGVILALYRVAKIDKHLFAVKLASTKGIALHGLAWLVMTYLTLIGWTFFRAESIGDAFAAISIFNHGFVSGEVFMTIGALEQAGQFAFYVLPLVFVQILQANRQKLEVIWDNLSSPSPIARFVGINFLFFILSSLLFLSAQSGQAFIYFDF
jgi:alginate O-acetyltransferase complex protein AlgI